MSDDGHTIDSLDFDKCKTRNLKKPRKNKNTRRKQGSPSTDSSRPKSWGCGIPPVVWGAPNPIKRFCRLSTNETWVGSVTTGTTWFTERKQQSCWSLWGGRKHPKAVGAAQICLARSPLSKNQLSTNRTGIAGIAQGPPKQWPPPTRKKTNFQLQKKGTKKNYTSIDPK